MGWVLLMCLWVSLVVLLQIQRSFGCLEEERIALLEIKASIKWTDDDYEHGFGLPSWVDDRRSDCCGWERVVCNHTTGRVTHLSLYGMSAYAVTWYSDQVQSVVWNLNLTMFSAFEDLQHLNLSFNSLPGWIKNEGFERLNGLRKLEVLDLGHNHFDNSIVSSLGALMSLRTLSLTHNYLTGSQWEELVTLHNLQSLDLSFNTLKASSQVIKGSKRHVGWRKLEILDLGWNNFNNSIFPSLGAITTLRTLYLDTNNLEGFDHFEELGNLHSLQSLDLTQNGLNGSSQTLQVLCELKSLQELNLSMNYFEGILPPCLQNLTSLRTLFLSYNRFKGEIPSSVIASLTSLEHISLSSNDFEGTFTFNTFANSSKLELIELQDAGIKLEVETEYPPWVPPFQLKALLLSNCSLNKNTNSIPRFLSSQFNLVVIDLSDNNLKGLFPNWLLENNKMLEAIILSNNSLGGNFHLSFCMNRLLVVEVSNNCINGQLQENIGEMLPNVSHLGLSKNCFEGGIPSSIGDMKWLQTLDLSHNNFSGGIPYNVAVGCAKLQSLILSYNRLHGQVFPPHFNMTGLYSLHLENNTFSGNILPGLLKCSQLSSLNIGNNKITGTLPSWIKYLRFLVILNMKGNFLEGNIPNELFTLSYLYFLDLSENNLSGSIPSSFFNLTELRHLNLQGNYFTWSPPGNFVDFVGDSNLVTLAIGDNNLGSIPDWIGALSNLRVLLAPQNHFSGKVPEYLCQLSLIGLMDLSYNNLSGSIPICFNNITFGRDQGSGVFAQVKGIVGISYCFSYSYLASRRYPTEEEEFVYEENVEGEEVVFITKTRHYSYSGTILDIMFGLDLSCNNLTGEIPHEIGELNGIRALNLSHNQLTGSIPINFSNLTQVESLDLSYNDLSREIPSELLTLYSLEVFSVAHNNLSGRTPDMKAQFGTFNVTSYEGNPLLCGPPLPRNCSSDVQPTNKTTSPSNGVEEEDGIDMDVFVVSFAASYAITLLGFVAVLYINRYWRRMWFHFIEECIYSCGDAISDTWYKLSICVKHIHFK